METYQPIYDAARSKFSHCDVESIIKCAIENVFYNAGNRMVEASAQHDTPFVLLKPKVFKKEHQWCALYGENLQDGVAGFGSSPFEAQTDFDKAWYKKISQKSD